MIIFVSSLAVLIVVLFFFSMGRRKDGSSFRKRFREKHRTSPQPIEPPDPNFQFDHPTTTNNQSKPNIGQ